ncbi:MAG: hypothetical protein LBB90_00205 [Tannerella sp.]|jgi:hypothetical protein|nr:hypothetical protein [Tannerella sp.]
MAKNRKKKSSSQMPHPTLKLSISKAQFDTGCAIARKTIQLMGFDPASFDMLTKKQKHALLDIEPPMLLVRTKSGCHVPRQYVNNIRTSTMAFLRTVFVKEEFQLTYMEFLTYGLPFLFIVKVREDHGLFTSEQEDAFVRDMTEKFINTNMVTSGWFVALFAHLRFELNFYSQANFRTYGFEFVTDIPKHKEIFGMPVIRCIIELTSHENESIHFVHRGIKRKAYGMLLGSTAVYIPSPAVIQRRKLYPERPSSAEYMLYIQSHVIHRIKERIDIFDASTRNYLINTSLVIHQKVVKSITGHPLIACFVSGVPLGYFPWTIQGDKLFILSFLPLVSQVTPEGAKLYQLLKFSKEDLIYLGMDKLSFFMTVDFEEIPVLKNALVESGIWHVKQKLDETCEGESQIDWTKTQFVKNFFRKTESRQLPALPGDENETQIQIPEVSEEWND